MVKWGRCRLASQDACGAGGAPAPGSGATTPLPEAGVRKHPAPEGALRQFQVFFLPNSSPSQKAPSTRRCIKTQLTRAETPIQLLVRKHPAPEGALRHNRLPAEATSSDDRKAPSTRRCIKTRRHRWRPSRCRPVRKAPSTRRCIKTHDERCLRLGHSAVRKYPAPEGALRQIGFILRNSHTLVRKHPTPEGV